MPNSIADHLPVPLREALLAEIDPGEDLRWCGMPSARNAFVPAVVPALLGCAVCLGVGSFGIIVGYSIWAELKGLAPILPSEPGDRPTTFSAVAMIGLGLFMLCMALLALHVPWDAARKPRKTIYAVTNTRVCEILVLRAGGARVEALEPGHPLHLRRRDLKQRPGEPALSDISMYPGPHRRQGQLALFAVENGWEVERLIRATFDPPGAASP